KMRVLAAVVGLAVVAAASLADGKDKTERDTYEYSEAIAQANVDQKKAIAKFLAEVQAFQQREETTNVKEEKRDDKVIKWHSMSEVRRMQNEGRKLVIARVDPDDATGMERRMEVVANELRARGAEEAIWVKRSVPSDDDVVWLGWEGVPITTELFLLTGDPKQAAQLYKGSESITDLLTWLLQYLPPLRPREIETEKEMDEFMLASPVSVIAYVPRELGEDGSILALVKKIARRHPYLPVGVVYPAEELPYTKHALGPISIYYRDEDHIFPLDEDRLREMDDFTRDNALKRASHQFISRFPDDAAHIFAQGIDKIVFVFAAAGQSRGQTPSYLRELALEMRQRVVIAYVDAADERMDGVREMFGVESAQTVRGFDARTERQYWPKRATSDHPLLPYEVETFVRDLAANKLTPHCKVEQIEPADNEGAAVLRLNTRTFEETALSPSVDAVVCFFATWCPHSRRFLEKFAKAAEESRGKRKVIFGVVDAEKNDVEMKNKIRLFPTVILFRKDTNEEVVFSGRRSVPELLKWLDEEMVKEPKVEAPVQEEDVTARDYESPLKKKIKDDFEQRYTLDGLSPSKVEKEHRGKATRKSRGEVAMEAVETMMAERVLTKLKVDRPIIADGLESARKFKEWFEKEDEDEESTVDERKDTVDEKSTVEEKKMDTVVEKEVKKDTVVDKKKDKVEDQKSTVEDVKKDTVAAKKDTESEKSTVADVKITLTDKKSTLAEKEKAAVDKKDTVVEKKDTVPEKEQQSKEKAPEPAAKKDTVIEKPDTVEKPKSTVVDPKEEITVDEEAPKKNAVEKQPPVKSEL
ncbi:hypothetical protein PRIPAC_77066, partial [Pristionchus pacificus]